MVQFIFDGDPDAEVTILLAHGAGAPMDSASMNAASENLAAQGFRVARFEFCYMAARRTDGARKPPPNAEMLKPEYMSALQNLAAKGLLVIGGKSMGGRVASMIADELHAAGRISGLLCLGYPFHPPGKPESLRTGHLENLQTPTLIVQGTRDEFGTRAEVETYPLSDKIRVLWLEDGDHNLKPRRTISGFTAADHMRTMVMAVSEWTCSIRNSLI